jgi:DNA-binding response OmpR family regulator
VLVCLARRAGQVVAKTEVIDEVWDLAFDGDVNIVEVYVRALRQRLDEPFGRRSIETVRGAGYRLVDDRV